MRNQLPINLICFSMFFYFLQSNSISFTLFFIIDQVDGLNLYLKIEEEKALALDRIEARDEELDALRQRCAPPPIPRTNSKCLSNSRRII
jgi:hypothetical protein